MTKALIVCLSSLLVSCATMQGSAHPQTRYMSAARHRQAAAEEETQASQDDREAYEASADGGSCGSPVTTRPQGASVDDVCLSARREATNEYEWEATLLRKHASEHRVAAAELEEAETTACQGLSKADQILSPFYRWSNITFVNPRLDGATIVFGEEPGLTREYMKRLVDCHRARDAALGYDVPEAAYSPLALKGIDSAVVTQLSQGIGVTITSSQHPVAVEISARARHLIAREPRPMRQAGAASPR